MEINVQQVYVPRRTAFVQRLLVSGWRLKLYHISVDDADLSTDVFTAAVRFVENEFDWPQNLPPQCGFITIHCGKDANWLLIDLWANEILHHFLFASDLQNPTEFLPGPKDGTHACVWEMEVTKHERDAWVSHVLSKPQSPDVEAYLDDVLHIPSPVRCEK